VLYRFDTWPWATGGAFYIIGAVVYAFRWPECFSNGKYDYFGNSHNIFHIFVVMAALMHWYGSVRVFHERQMYACPV
jgi:adiponectin receptor